MARDLEFSAIGPELLVAPVAGGAILTMSARKALASGSPIINPDSYPVDADEYDVSRVHLAWNARCEMDWITAHNLRVANEP